MSFTTFSDIDLIDRLGWTLAHSLWQLALISAALFLVLRLVPRNIANARYAISVGALVLSVLVPIVTFLQISTRSDHADLSTTAARFVGYDDRRLSSDRTEIFPPTFDVGREVNNDDQSNTLFSIHAVTDLLQKTLPSLFPIAISVWIIGIALFSLRLFGGLWTLGRYKRSGATPEDGEWQTLLAALAKTLKVDRSVTLVRSDLLATPIAVGIIKPMIIIPTSVFLQMPPAQLETIIAHELIHIRRYDCLINAFQSFAEIVLFYHPAVWWISAEIRREREYSADAAVLKVASDRLAYATALADLEELRHSAGMTVPSNAMAANGGRLMQRITRILNKKTEISRASSAWSAGMAFAVISILLLALFSFSPGSIVKGQKRSGNDRKIAIGFVSIPPIDRSENPPKDSYATAQLLMKVLRSYRIPATGFVTGSSISDGTKIFPVRAEIVKMWRDQGFDIGVGGFKHLSFYDTPYDDYVVNTEKNEAVIKNVLGSDTPLRYFSYPYLNTGRSTADRDRFEAWLATQNLSSVKYTVDNNEWMYSFAYDMARNDNDISTMKQIRASFLDYMSKMFDHFESYSRNMFGRDIPQTMVLTSSRLVADTGDDLFGMLEKRGYKFVPISDAQSDSAYQTPEDFMGKAGISWFERWQMKQGKPLLDEPVVDPEIQRTWDAKRPGAKSKNQ
jgi:beta-lactamase regulating signal transducer with metallopeptidase domain/peptidoglycan/xylan/chitin deacetylase (PgdA/CDA1 family)